MGNKITVYNEKVLKELAKNSPEKWAKIEHNQKEKWLTKEAYPTYHQLVKIASAFNIPFGYLFLDELPKKELPIPHFRSKGFQAGFSDELYDTVMFVKKQQEWAKEILLDWGHEPLPFAGKFSIHTDIQTISNEIKTILGIQNGWAAGQITWKNAFSELIHKLEEAGIFVVVNGVVGNNTHRPLRVDEFRGFVLYDEVAPFVFVNNNDFISAKIFTLIHELVHILIGESAAFDLEELQSSYNEKETFCDHCAAEFLVPENDIKNIAKPDYEKLAKQFKVSQIVIARRLLDIGKISKNDFLTFYNHYKNKEIKKHKEEGGDFYNTAINRYGRKFLSIIHSALSNKEILHRDVYRLLSLSPQTVENILQKIAL